MNRIADITVMLHGVPTDALVEYRSEYEPADPEVGYFRPSMNCTIIRVLTVSGRFVADELSVQEKARIECVLADEETEKIKDENDRILELKMEGWEAKRKGE